MAFLPIFQSPVTELTQLQTSWASLLNPLLQSSSSVLLATKSDSFTVNPTFTPIQNWDAANYPSTFNSVNGIFTADVAGLYFTFGCYLINSSVQTNRIILLKNNVEFSRDETCGVVGQNSTPKIITILPLNVGDTLSLAAEVASAPSVAGGGSLKTRFEIVRLSS